MQLQFGLTSYQRGKGGLPDLPVVNLLLEEAPTETKGVSLLSRPGLATTSTLAHSPIRGLYKQDGVLGSALFAVAGTKLYRNGTLVGTMSGSGPWSFGGYQNTMFAAGGAALWSYNGSTLAAVSFPDGASVAKVLVGNSRVVAIRADTQKYYFSDPLENDIEALDFTSAESQPDRLLDMVFLNGVLWLGGAETIEPHMATGSSTLPFQPILGRVINKGVKATGCMAVLNGQTFVYVSNENQVRLEDGTVLSNMGLEDRIAVATRVRLFPFLMGGTEYLALRMTFADGTGETQVWNQRAGAWSEFQTYGRANWGASCFAGGVFGSAYDGNLMAWGTDYTDALATGGILERRIRAGLPVNGGAFAVNNLRARCEVGQSPYLTGNYVSPTMEMRLSPDAGQTWGYWDNVTLGEQGSYGTMAEWRALGLASYPAFLTEVRVTDPVSVRFSDVLINENWGGR